MIKINVSADVKRLTASLNDIARKQIPFAIATALNGTAKGAQADVKAKLPSIFDRPTSWTMNSIYVQKANKNRLEADIHLKDWPQNGGIPAGKYLQWQIMGGPRRQKSFEKKLSAAGVGTTGFFAPAYGAAFDGYGNMSAGQIVAILSSMNAMNDTAAKSLHHRFRGMRKDDRYVVINAGNAPYKNGNGLRPGIYLRRGAAVIPVLWFIPQPSYTAIFPFQQLGAESAQRRFPDEFKKALDRALATAR